MELVDSDLREILHWKKIKKRDFVIWGPGTIGATRIIYLIRMSEFNGRIRILENEDLKDKELIVSKAVTELVHSARIIYLEYEDIND